MVGFTPASVEDKVQGSVGRHGGGRIWKAPCTCENSRATANSDEQAIWRAGDLASPDWKSTRIHWCPEGVRAQGPGLYVIGRPAPETWLTFSGCMSGFLKSTDLGFREHKNPDLGCRPGLDRVIQTAAQALPWKSSRAQWGLPLGPT